MLSRHRGDVAPANRAGTNDRGECMQVKKTDLSQYNYAGTDQKSLAKSTARGASARRQISLTFAKVYAWQIHVVESKRLDHHASQAQNLRFLCPLLLPAYFRAFPVPADQRGDLSGEAKFNVSGKLKQAAKEPSQSLSRGIGCLINALMMMTKRWYEMLIHLNLPHLPPPHLPHSHLPESCGPQQPSPVENAHLFVSLFRHA